MTSIVHPLHRLRRTSLLCVAILSVVRPVSAAAEVEDSRPPGVIVAQTPLPKTQYIGSPSIAILPDGTYVASHDFFGKSGPNLRETHVYASHDRGETWTPLASFPAATWGSLFVHRGNLYHMAITDEPGNVVIRRSFDGGRTWSDPKDAHTGVLLSGKFHSAPVPVVAYGGRLWRAVEETVNDRKWPRHFGALMLSAPVDADLLEAANWTRTNCIVFDPAWLPGRRPGWLEGNAVVTPEGGVANVLRVNTELGPDAAYELQGPAAGIPRFEVAARADVSADGRSLAFDPTTGFLHFPGGLSKFTIRHDAVSGRYWALVNKVTRPHAERAVETEPAAQRNVVILTSSADLRHWTEHRVILQWRPGELLTRKDRHGFQYLDWQFDGDDLVAVARTAWNADSFHNANYLTFHRVRDFRAEATAGK